MYWNMYFVFYISVACFLLDDTNIWLLNGPCWVRAYFFVLSYGLNILMQLLNRSYLFHLKFDMIQLQLMVYFVSFNGWNSKLVSHINNS